MDFRLLVNIAMWITLYETSRKMARASFQPAGYGGPSMNPFAFNRKSFITQSSGKITDSNTYVSPERAVASNIHKIYGKEVPFSAVSSTEHGSIESSIVNGSSKNYLSNGQNVRTNNELRDLDDSSSQSSINRQLKFQNIPELLSYRQSRTINVRDGQHKIEETKNSDAIMHRDKQIINENYLTSMHEENEDVFPKHAEGDPECTAVYSCLDCFTARVCHPLGNGSFEQVKTIRCGASTPYCDSETGTCKYRADNKCLEPDDFTCLADGHFPDSNCKYYHVCTNLTSEKRQCESEHENYNADRGICDTETTDCGVFDCYQQSSGIKVPLSTFQNYFAYCDGHREPLVIDKCPEGTWLNVTSQKCEPMCFEIEGVIQDPTDCTKYYKCTKLWFSMSFWFMMKERKGCPLGTGFDPKNFGCISLDDNPRCRDTQLNGLTFLHENRIQ